MINGLSEYEKYRVLRPVIGEYELDANGFPIINKTEYREEDWCNIGVTGLHNMGSRGAFESVDLGNFAFKEGGQHYKSIGTLSSDSNVKIIIQDSKSVKAPEYSHTPGRIYAVVKDGQLKHLAYYDDSHKQAVSIDFAHEHQGVQPHRHVYLNHDKNSPGVPPTASEDALIKKIKKEFHLR